MLVSGSVALGETEMVIIIVPVKIWLNWAMVTLNGPSLLVQCPQESAIGPSKTSLLASLCFFAVGSPVPTSDSRSDDSERANPRSSNTFSGQNHLGAKWGGSIWPNCSDLGQPLHYMVV